MKKLILFIGVALSLTGCATSPSSSQALEAEPLVYATPAERAYQMGLEYRMIQGCEAQIGSVHVSRYAQSAELLLSSYPATWRDAAHNAFNQGFSTGPARFHSIPCESVKSLIPEQIACNEAATRKNLKTAAKLR